MRSLCLALVLCLMAAAPVMAQSASEPIMGSTADPAGAAEAPDTPESQRTMQVLVLGDAIGGGLGAGLTRVTQDEDRYDVSIRFNEESGLARPEVYDWPATLSKILETSSYDVIVVLIGTNDRQPIRSGEDRLGFGTAEWTTAYTAKIDALLAELKQSGARVFWVSIPPMADADYDASMRTIARLQRERVEANGFTYVDIRAAFTTPTGDYTDSGPDDTGETHRLRGRDGISFYKAGNNRMGQLVLQAMISDKTERPPASASATDQTGGEPQLASESIVPLFGQILLGEIVTVMPKDVTVNAVALTADGLAPSAALDALKAMSPAGSGAEKLFRLGSTAPAPAGRVDDFSVPSQAN